MNPDSESQPPPYPPMFGPFWRALAELELLALAPVALILVGRYFPPGFLPFGPSGRFLSTLIHDYGYMESKTLAGRVAEFCPDLGGLELALAFWAGALPLLALIQIRAFTRAGVLLIAASLFALYCVVGAVQASFTIQEAMNSLPENALPDPWIPVPAFFIALRSLARLLLPFIAGVILSGRRFRPWIFGIGYFVSALLIDAIYNARSPIAAEPILGSAMLTALACLPWMLPFQRAALARFFGHSNADAPPADPRDESSVAYRALSILAIAALLLLIPFGATIGYVERRAAWVMAHGAPPPHRSPGLIDAGASLHPYSLKDASEQLPDCPVADECIPNAFSGYVLPAFYPPELARQAIQKTSPDALKAFLEFHRPRLEAIESLREADCWEYSNPNGIRWGFIVVRESARALAFRSLIRLCEGQMEDAARDIDSLFRLGTLFRTDGTLIHYMIGTALAGIATSAAYEYYLFNRDSPENLAAMIRAMEKIAPRVRHSFDFEMLRRNEIGWWSISLYPEVLAASFFNPGTPLAAVRQYYLKWLDFEFVMLAMKLELCRHDRGAYPDSLEQLVPEYMDRVPLDPFDGGRIVYKNLGAEFDLTTLAYERFFKNDPTMAFIRMPFPVSKSDTPKAREDVEKWIPAPYAPTPN